MSVSVFLYPILSAAAVLVAQSAVGEFGKGIGKTTYDALKNRLLKKHKIDSIALLEQAGDNPTDAAAIKADLDAADLAHDPEIKALADTLLAALEALPQDQRPAVALQAEEIRAKGDQVFRNIDGIDAGKIISGGAQTFENIKGGAGRSYIGKIKANEVTFITKGIGALALAAILAVVIAVAIVAMRATDKAPVISKDLIETMARAAGYGTPDQITVFQETVQRTQADLNALRAANPDWKAEVDKAIKAFNASKPEEAEAAFNRLDALMVERRAELRLEEARSKNAQATLLYPFKVSKAEPLRCAAAYLAQEDFWYWVDCGRAREALGNLKGAEAAYGKAEALAMRADPEGRDASVIKNELGRIFVASGKLPAALQVYEESLEIARALAAADGANAGWQRDVSVSLERIGDVRRTQGDLAGALAVYEESLAIARALAAADGDHAGWQRDVSVALNRVGDVRLEQGDLAGAGVAYEEGLAIARALAAADDANAGWQRDVSVSLDRVGDVRQAQGDLAGALEVYQESLAIRRTLAAADSAHAGWQRDVSVSLEKVGNVRRAQGDLGGALAVYEESLKIARALAEADSAHAGWQRDVSVALEKVGDVRRAQGDLAGALAVYEESLKITRALALKNPQNAEWQRDLAVSYWKFAQVDKDNAATHWAAVVDQMEAMKARGILFPSDEKFLTAARKNLAAARED